MQQPEDNSLKNSKFAMVKKLSDKLLINYSLN